MNSSNLEDIILQAIDIVATKKVNAAGYDKTIQAIVISCVDQRIGKYKIKYQDSYFFAYSNNINVNYLQGTSVYVLVPNGNMSNDKTILGTVKGLGVDYNEITEQDRYVEVGNNVLASQNSYSLCSYKTEQKILYSKDLDENIINIDKQQVYEYIKNSEALLLKFYIQTAMPSQQRYQGNYGVLFGLDFLTEDNQITTRYYYMDVDNMTGNPYNFINKVKQEKTFEIDNQNFVQINLISIFSKDFPYQREGENDDIFITQLSLNGIDFLSNQDLESYALTLVTPAGYIFAESQLGSAERSIQAQLRVKGKIRDLDANVYWFRQNNNVTSGSLKYSSYGGQGWECLNPYQIISSNPQIYDFIPTGKTYTVTKSDLYSERTKYKCIVLYENNILSKEITFIKSGAEYKFEIQSSNGTTFHFNQGETQLTCNVYQKISSQYIPVTVFTGLTFSWIKVNNANNFQNINTEVSQVNEYALQNKVYNTNIKGITNFITYKCSILDTTTGVCFGTASITLTNDTQQEINAYNLVINNGNQLFKYNTYGIAPTSRRLDAPQAIPALSFTLYDSQGEEIQNTQIDSSAIVWNVPNKDTLIKPDSSYTGTVSPDGAIITFTGMTSFVYSIAQMYDFVKTNNEIQLQITYDNTVTRAKTTLLFVKQGEDGTNGTEFVCKIIPNVASGDYPNYPTLIYYSNSGAAAVDFNWISGSLTTWFKVQLWNNNNEPIFTGSKTGTSTEGKTVTIDKWEILQNVYATNKKDNSDISVSYSTDWSYTPVTTGAPSLVSYDASTYQAWRPANILKVTVQYDNKVYYATLPIVIAKLFDKDNYRVSLKDYSGFLRVLYNESGQLPQYNNTSPFEIITEQKVNNVWTDVSLQSNINYEWFYEGSTWYKNSATTPATWVEDYETTTNGESSKKWLTKAYTYGTLQKNQMYIRPIDTYDGLCVNTGLACRVYTSSATLAWIHIPIHMSFNRFGIAAINDWDGNSVELGDNGGMIIAPQVGAGTKDNNNAFTGVVIGTSRDPNQQISNGKEDVGLFAYSAGRRSVFIDAKTGKATFGETGQAQIIIDPTQTVNGRKVAEIRSGNYAESTQSTTGAGLLIDLTSPAIKFGSGKFSVNSNGELTATGANITGNITATSLTLGTNANVPSSKVSGLATVATSGSYTDLDPNTTPDLTVYVAKNGTIGTLPTSGATSSSTTGFRVSGTGLLQASNAIIYGTIYSSSGLIGGLTLSNNSLSYSNNSGDEVYVGIDRISSKTSSAGIAGLSDGAVYQQASSNGKGVNISNGFIKLFKAGEVNNYSLSLDTFSYSASGSIPAYTSGALTIKDKSLQFKNKNGNVFFTYFNEALVKTTGQALRTSFLPYFISPLACDSNLYVQGNFTVTGTKNRSVNTNDYGKRLLYCQESCSPMFSDIGSGIINEDGFCYVSIDPIFSETVETSNYYIFLQKEDNGECYIYKKDKFYFIIKGTPNLKFYWEIKAKQKEFDQKRLQVNQIENFVINEEIDYGEQAVIHIQQTKAYL